MIGDAEALGCRGKEKAFLLAQTLYGPVIPSLLLGLGEPQNLSQTFAA